MESVLAAHPKVRALFRCTCSAAVPISDPIVKMANERRIRSSKMRRNRSVPEYKAGEPAVSDGLALSAFSRVRISGTVYGDSGIMTTDDAALNEKMMALRVHGRTGKYFHQWIGVNSRLDSLQAAVLRVKLRYLDNWSAGRERNAGQYRHAVAETRSSCDSRNPPRCTQTRHVYDQFVIRCEQTRRLAGTFREHGIGSEVYYPLPLHLQPCYTD